MLLAEFHSMYGIPETKHKTNERLFQISIIFYSHTFYTHAKKKTPVPDLTD